MAIYNDYIAYLNHDFMNSKFLKYFFFFFFKYKTT